MSWATDSVRRAYRVGPLKSVRGVFFADSYIAAAPYIKVDQGPEWERVKEYIVKTDRPLVAKNQYDAAVKLGLHDDLQDAHADRDTTIHVDKTLPSDWWMDFDKKIADTAKSQGYDALVYTHSSPPSTREIAVLKPSNISLAHDGVSEGLILGESSNDSADSLRLTNYEELLHVCESHLSADPVQGRMADATSIQAEDVESLPSSRDRFTADDRIREIRNSMSHNNLLEKIDAHLGEGDGDFMVPVDHADAVKAGVDYGRDYSYVTKHSGKRDGINRPDLKGKTLTHTYVNKHRTGVAPDQAHGLMQKVESDDHREFGKQGIYNAPKGAKYLTVGNHVDFYDQTGSKKYGQIVHVGASKIHFKTSDGKVHKQILRHTDESSLMDQIESHLDEAGAVALDRSPTSVVVKRRTSVPSAGLSKDQFHAIVNNATPEQLGRVMHQYPTYNHFQSVWQGHEKVHGTAPDSFWRRARSAWDAVDVQRKNKPTNMRRHESQDEAERLIDEYLTTGLVVVQEDESEAPHRSKDLYVSLGRVLPELQHLVMTTVTQERQALSMLFNEIVQIHASLGNALSGNVTEEQDEILHNHYRGIYDTLLQALDPYRSHNAVVATASTGPYVLHGMSLGDSVE